MSTDGKVVFHEPVLKTDVKLNVRSGKAAENGSAPLLANGSGSWRGYPFELEGRVDSPLDFQNKDKPYRMDVRARAGQTKAHASGALRGQLQLENFNARFDLSGDNMADLYELVGIPFPDTPPYALKGTLDREGDVWSYRKFAGRIGDSDMAGDLLRKQACDRVPVEGPEGVRLGEDHDRDRGQQADTAEAGADDVRRQRWPGRTAAGRRCCPSPSRSWT